MLPNDRLAPLAHSAPRHGATPHSYRDHICAVAEGARGRAEEIAVFVRDASAANAFVDAVVDAATFHDLGKLDRDNQEVLRKGRAHSMPWDHVDAGVAHLLAHGAGSAAWAVRAHHAPGLPKWAEHFSTLGRNPDQVRKLRGRRRDDDDPARHEEQKKRTDDYLQYMVRLHHETLGPWEVRPGKTIHGLPLRLMLSCLVDADHTDTAFFDTGRHPPKPAAPRWEERLASLDSYVKCLPKGTGDRGHDRAAFYDECRNRAPDAALVTCEGPVGIGKTTAVVAYLLRRAIATKARRLFIVAPYTAILSQTADRLRSALVLPDEQDNPGAVVAEHHHRADFEDFNARDLALLWSAPIVLTTAVQFFETLASNAPSNLRKLHALPGSVVFIDEAHATLPTPLWPQNWRWLKSLAEDWSCSFVFASGSLARFWKNPDIVGDERLDLPDLISSGLTTKLNAAEGRRVAYRTLGRLAGPDVIAKAVLAAEGPRLLILNTVQSAAVMARHMHDMGRDVLHISTALCPNDRDAILKRIGKRLADRNDSDWTLVATSLVEAGVDLSFRSAFRERFSTASLIQVGGRVNRHAELTAPANVYDFFFDSGSMLNRHPGAKVSGDVLGELFMEGRLDGNLDPAGMVTLAQRRELRKGGAGSLGNSLLQAERNKDYPLVAELGRVIDTDTRLVVIDADLKEKIELRNPLSARELLAGSVQIWSTNIWKLNLSPIQGRKEIYWWPYKYDPEFLGYMDGTLNLLSIREGAVLIT